VTGEAALCGRFANRPYAARGDMVEECGERGRLFGRSTFWERCVGWWSEVGLWRGFWFDAGVPRPTTEAVPGPEAWRV
jgi:hypothetical protein